MAGDAAVTVAARLDRLPPTRHTRKLITLLSLGGWFEFYDLFFTAYVAIGLFKADIFKPTTQGLFDLHGFASFVASGFAGMFLGTLDLQLAIGPLRPALDLYVRVAVVLGRRVHHGVSANAGDDRFLAARLPASGLASNW